MTIYYSLDGNALTRNFNLWTDSDGCPTSWWISAMVSKTDLLTPSISYASDYRKVSIAKIAKDSNGKKVSAVGKFEREFTVKTRTGGDDLAKNAKLTVYVHDPDCKSATATSFNPTKIAKTYYIQASITAGEITLPSITMSDTNCKVLLKTPTMSLPTPSDATISTSTPGKVTYMTTTKDANIGHFELTLQYAHLDAAATPVTNGLIKAPVTVSTTACETGADIGSCTTDGCIKIVDHTIGSGSAAGSAAQFSPFKLKAGVTGCLFDYSATTIPTAIKDSLTLDASKRQSTIAKITTTTQTGFHDLIWSAKTIAKEVSQTSTLTQRYRLSNSACEKSDGAHLSVKTAKSTVFCELDDTKKATGWTCEYPLKDLFSSTVTDCFLTFSTDWKDKTPTTATERGEFTITGDDVNQKVKFAVKADASLTGKA